MTQILPILSRRSFVQTLQGQAFKYNLCFIVTTTLRFPITKISIKPFYAYYTSRYFYCEKVVALEVKKLDQGKRADCARVIKGY